MICKKCNSTVADTAKFCPKCGAKAEVQVSAESTQMIKCPKCGAENPLSAKFCKVDGYNLQAVEEKHTLKPVESEKPSNKVLCPKCGTSYDLGVKFCKKDGTPLQQGSASVRPAVLSRNNKKTELPQTGRAGGSKTKIVVGAAVVLVLLALAGAGSYLYFTGHIGKNPEKMTASINDELKGKGLSLYCEIDKDWIATLKGATRSATDKDVASNIIKAHKEIKDLKDAVQIQATPLEVKAAIDNALRSSGIRDIHAEVDETLTATLQGVASNYTEKESAMKIAAGLGKAKDVRDNIQIQATPPPPAPIERPATVQRHPRQDTRPRVDVTRKEVNRQRNIEPPPGSTVSDPAKVEGEINRALRNAGLSGITAEVGDDMSVTLKGSTVNPASKNKALDIATSFNGIRKVRDRIFVVR